MLKPPRKSRRFVQSSVIMTTLQEMKRYRADPRALARLTPPPIFMRVLRDDRRSLTEGEIEFTLWFGPLPIRWLARHENGPSPDSIADVQLRGRAGRWLSVDGNLDAFA